MIKGDYKFMEIGLKYISLVKQKEYFYFFIKGKDKNRITWKRQNN